MFLLAAVIFVMLGLLNEIWGWSLPRQVLTGTILATTAEFFTGCLVNLHLGWNIWDYSDNWGNILGQICPAYTLAWIPLAAAAIVLDDILRWRFFGKQRPHYLSFL